MPEVSDLQVQRLLCAIYPTWYEKALDRFKSLCWQINEQGPTGWLGDRADDLGVWSYDRRARRNLS